MRNLYIISKIICEGEALERNGNSYTSIDLAIKGMLPKGYTISTLIRSGMETNSIDFQENIKGVPARIYYYTMFIIKERKDGR